MKLILLFAFQSVFFLNAFCQDIQTLINRFNQDSLLKTVRELSGEDSVIINGTNTIITYRAAYIGSNLTEDYLKARLSGYGLNVQTQKYSINGLNVFGIQEGTKFPNEAFIVGAHHDAVTFYCADDNASGCAAVMETARILSETNCDYTIIYAFWDEEEAGLWGSNYQAKQAKANGQMIKGIVVLDMIGYDSNNDKKFDIHVNNEPSSLSLADSITNLISRYNLNLVPQIINPGSDRGDHYSFWRQGYLNTIGVGERIFTDDPNPAYHTENDRIDIFNVPYFAEISKMTVGLSATIAKTSVTSVSDYDQFMSDIDIFPNPTNGSIIINIKNNMPVRIIVTNTFGGILTENNFIQPVIKLDLTNFPAGIYFVSIIDNDRILTRKILKSN